VKIEIGDTTFTVLFPDLVRPLTEEERLTLRQSIEENGIQCHIVIDESNGIIDGINRLTLADSLGIPLADIPLSVREGLSLQQKRELALELNTARRMLSREEVKAARQQRVQRVAELRAEGKKTREIAEEVGVSQMQVRRDLDAMASIETDVSMPTHIQTSDGRSYPAKQKKAEPQEEPAPVAADPEEDEDEDDSSGDRAEAERGRQARSEKREADRLAEMKERAKQAPKKDDRWEIHLADCSRVLWGTPDYHCESARLVFADPPYNIGWDYGGGGGEDSLPASQYIRWCDQWMARSYDCLTPDGSFWLLIGDEFVADLKIAAEDTGFTLRQWLIWYESFGVNCTTKFGRTHRHLLWFVKDPKNFVFHGDAVKRPSDRQVKYADPRAAEDGKIWDSVWGINPPIHRVAGTHAEAIPGSPAPQLPLGLLRPIIACASDPGDLVIDPFCGNATTGVAALELGRRFVGFELRKPIRDLAVLRMRAASVKGV
jgi:DNA modification methylase